MSTSKIRLKFDYIEFDYEGSEEFLKTEIPVLLSGIAALHGQKSTQQSNSGTADANQNAGSGSGQQLTTNSIAAKIAVKSGPELAKAAALRLTIFGGKSTFSRSDLIKEMRTATTYFKTTYVNNLSGTLARLLSDNVFLESSPEVYALQASALTSLKATIGG